MYSIIKFLVPLEKSTAIVKIGESMNRIRAGIFTGLRAKGDGVAFDLVDGGTWDDHVAKMKEFLTEFRAEIDAACAIGADITIDVAVWPEDLERVPFVVVRQEPDLMRFLADHGVAIEVSVYA